MVCYCFGKDVVVVFSRQLFRRKMVVLFKSIAVDKSIAKIPVFHVDISRNRFGDGFQHDGFFLQF